MQQTETTQLRNKKILIISSVVTLFILLGIVYFYTITKQTKQQVDLLKTVSEKKQTQLTSISGYLQELDRIILTNQSHLSDAVMLQPEMTKNLSALYSNLEKLENQLAQIGAAIRNEVSETNQILITDHLSALSETQQAIIDSILFSKETITDILSAFRLEQNNQYSSVIEKINNLAASFSYTEAKLQAYHKELLNLGDSIQNNISENQTELLASIGNMQITIEALLNDYVLQLDMELQKSFLILAEKLESIHQQIAGTEELLHFILTDMQATAELNQAEILESFNSLQFNIDTISSDVNEAHLQIQNLLSTLSEDTANNHKETLETLNNMETGLQDFSQKHFAKITASISDMQASFNSSLSTVKTELAATILSLDTELSTILSEYNASTTNQLNSIQSSVDNQYSSFTNILNANDNELRMYMENTMKTVNQNLKQVFTYVSSGKSNLASALLTKGVSCSQDATFAEIRQAILDIPQKVVIGTAELPGEISYEYHYHKDKNSHMPHTELHSEKGGCYSSPVYHIHTGDSLTGGGCYGTPISHTHTDSCYSITKTERKVTGYWFTGEGTGHGCCSSSHGQNWARFRYVDSIYKNGELISSTSGEGELGYCCGLCISDKAAAKGYSSTNTAVICGYSEGLNGYALSCGMTNNTVISYKPSCGFSDGQITGAHILYLNNTTHNEG